MAQFAHERRHLRCNFLASTGLLLRGQDVVHAAQQVCRLYGFQQIVFGPESDRFDGGFQGGMGGEDKHRHQRIMPAEFLQQRDAVHLGHLDIQERQIVRACLQKLAGLPGAGGGRHLVARLVQNLRKGSAQVRLIVDYQDRRACSHILLPT